MLIPHRAVRRIARHAQCNAWLSATRLPRMQFRLKALFVLIAAVSLPLAVRARREHQYRQRLAAQQILENEGLSLHWDGARRSPDAEDALARDDIVVGLSAPGFEDSSDKTLAALRCFPALTWLDCSDSYISDAALEVFGKLHGIERLDLSDTKIGDEGVRHLANLGSLRELRLYNTRITDAALAHLASMSQLEELYLKGTEISDRGIRHLSALRSLQILDLSGTNVTGATLDSLAGLPELRVLGLRETPLTDEGVRRLSAQRCVRALDLSDTKITDAVLPYLSSMLQLEELSLAGAGIGVGSLRDFARLSKLRVLYLCWTQVSDQNIGSLCGSPSLEYLWLDGCPITNEGFKPARRGGFLSGTTSPIRVCLFGTSVTLRGAEALRAARPNVHVSWGRSDGEYAYFEPDGTVQRNVQHSQHLSLFGDSAFWLRSARHDDWRGGLSDPGIE